MGTTITLTNGTAGGTWTSSNLLLATVNKSTGLVNALSAGTVTISYTVGVSTVTQTVTVNGSPVPTTVSGVNCMDIKSIAGSTTYVAGSSGDGGPATAALLNYPNDVKTDAAGNIYIADLFNNKIRKVNSSGIISTIAGTSTYGYNGDGIAATAAELWYPTDVAVDVNGNVYISDQSNYCIRKINTSGIISTIAGVPGTYGYSGDGGPATAALMYGPAGLYCDATGNLYVSDVSASTVRKISPSGIITLFAGTPNVFSYTGDNGPATAATFDFIDAVSGDKNGNIYVTDQTDMVVRKISPTGTITTIAGNGSTGYTGDGGAATSATFYSPDGVAVDLNGNIFVSDGGNQVIRMINPAGIVNTVAGIPGSVYTADGGPATALGISGTVRISTDGAGNVYAATPDMHIIKLSHSGDICFGSGTITMSDATTGGTWSSVGSSISIGTGTGVVTGLTTGGSIVTYTLSNGCYTTSPVTVKTSPGPITGTLTLTTGGSTTLSNTTTGGMWTSGNIGIATVGSASGIVNGVTTGTAIINYSVGTCATNITVTVNAATASNVFYSKTTGGDASILTNWWSNNNNTGSQPSSFSNTGVTWVFQSAMTSTAPLTFAGNVSIVSGGSFTPLSASTTTVGGNWKNTGGTFTANGGTVLFNGANGVAADTISGSSGGLTGANKFNNLTFNSPSASYNFLSNAADVGGVFLQSSGTVIAPSANLNLGSNFTHNGGTFAPNGGTVTMNGGSSTMTVTGMTTATSNCLNNLSFNASSSATYTISSDLLLMGNFSGLTANGTMDLGSHTLTVGGNWSNLGPFTQGAGHNIIYNGTGSPITITGNQ